MKIKIGLLFILIFTKIFSGYAEQGDKINLDYKIDDNDIPVSINLR